VPTRRFLPLVALLLPAAARADGDPRAVSYEKDVRPLLAGHCGKCHDGKKRQSGFRVDVRADAFKGGESEKPGIVPGKAAESELYRRLVAEDESERMPPKKALPAKDIATIKAWIDAGAKWPDALSGEVVGKHWAFESPTRPAVPPVAPHPIDAFVGARLAKEGLAPAPPADPITLCRRLYLDLVGLPPTPKQVDAFVTAAAADRTAAVNALVEELLASPHYGERWGRLWLDAARYADSDGFEKDKPRFVWFYRDWVVRALNNDMPYDRFVTEQLAGDLLPHPTQDQLVATGFLRNSMINEEGGVDPEQFRMEAMFDRMDAIGKAVLGLTVQCAQCHTHKYDPITHADYYRLFAYLNNSHEANVTVYTPDEQRRRADVLRRVREIEEALRHRTPDWPAKMAAWERTVKGDQPEWVVMTPTVPDETTGGAKYLPQPDGSLLQQSYAPTKHGVRLEWTTPLKDITGFRVELLNDPNLPRGGPGRSIEGTAALTEFEVSYGPADGSGEMQKVKFVRATSDVAMPPTPLKAFYHDKGDNSKRLVGPAEFAIDGKNETAWGHDTDPGRRNRPRKAVFVPEKPIPGHPKGTTIHVVLRQNHGGWNSDDNQNCNLGRVRVSVTTAPNPVADPLPMNVRDIVERVPAEKRSAAQTDAVFAHWRTTVAGWKAENEAIDKLWAEHPEGTTQLALAEREAARTTHVLKRGDFLKPAEPVGPGVPGFLHPAAKDLPPNRLGLARWLTDPRSPTTARAFVNRVWQAYFGQGLVGSAEDFGTQGDKPTHPELLDWLACEFMSPTPGSAAARGGPPAPAWSIKHLHRLIVTSATYQQSSKLTPDAAKDPGNKLLARGPRVRADAEVVRDVALAASGLLNPAVGGPPVYPPVPQFLMLPPSSYGPKAWPESTGPDRYRRSLYVFRFRSVPYPALQAFDAPTGDFACVKRTRSNTPLQALTAMNEPVFVAAARALGRRALAEGGATDADRLTYAFRLCVARPPTADESRVLLDLLAKQTAKYAAADADPWAVAFAGPDEYKSLPHTATPAQASAWTAVARVLLNLDETMTKE
jgi:mono/diheme cytochrome c family protein